MARWLFCVVAEFPDDVTQEQIDNVLGDCTVMVAEPILERRDDGNDVEGTSTVVDAAVIRLR